MPQDFIPLASLPGGLIPGPSSVRGPQSFAERFADWLHDHRLPASLDPQDMYANPVGIAAVGRNAMGGSMSPAVRVNQGFQAISDRSGQPLRELADLLIRHGQSSTLGSGM